MRMEVVLRVGPISGLCVGLPDLLLKQIVYWTVLVATIFVF